MFPEQQGRNAGAFLALSMIGNQCSSIQLETTRMMNWGGQWSEEELRELAKIEQGMSESYHYLHNLSIRRCNGNTTDTASQS